MKMKWATALIIIVATAAEARDAEPVRAQAFQKLVDCRAVKEPGERLTCYDREVAALETAEQTKNVMIVEKEQVKQAKRSLFGLPLPNLKLFGTGDESAEVTQIESKIASARSGMDGWTIRLADGSTWQQTDNRPFYRTPKIGLAVVVTRATLGSFIMRVDGSPGIKVKRII